MVYEMSDNLLARLLDPDEKPICAAPLAGWTDAPYRPILKMHGTRHVWIPFVSSHSVASRKSVNRDTYVREVIAEHGHVQIFGADPKINAIAAKILEESGAESIDFNCGCSVRKVHKGGGGSALLKDLDLLTENLRAIKESVDIPVSLKTRIGFYGDGDESGIEACRRASDLGYSWVTLHGRTARQKFDGEADLEAIRKLVDQLPIPVIGNGDIASPEDALKMFEQTGCAGVMVGRAIMGDPWFIEDTEKFIADGSQRPKRTRNEVVKTILLHQKNLLDHYGEDRRGVWEFRRHVGRYLRGFAQAAVLRNMIVRAEDPLEVTRMLIEFGEGRPPSAISTEM
jgi:tRNA-dihydrouridine synthase B